MDLFKRSQRTLGKERLFTIDNGRDLVVELSDFGASLRSCRYRGRELTIGYADPADYAVNPPYFSASVGRFANRIAGGRCSVGAAALSLAANNGPNHLHGGVEGFSFRTWAAEEVSGTFLAGELGQRPAAGVRFTLESPDGDQGYPGKLSAQVTVLITDDNQLAFLYRAVTEAETIINLTNHCYWNLQGEARNAIHEHTLQLESAGWLAVDETSIPTGKLEPMRGSAWDFSRDRVIGPSLSPEGAPADSPRVGIDHCFVLDPRSKRAAFGFQPDGSPAEPPLMVRYAARLGAPRSVAMYVHTSLPGVQVYTSNFTGGERGRAGAVARHAGLCLETQLFPDAPNQAAAFREIGARLGYTEAEMAGWDAVLKPGQVWRELTVHRFTGA